MIVLRHEGPDADVTLWEGMGSVTSPVMLGLDPSIQTGFGRLRIWRRVWSALAAALDPRVKPEGDKNQ